MLTSVFPRWDGDATPPFVQNLCELLAAEGYEVLVLVPHAKGAEFKEVRNGVEIRRHVYFWPFGLQKLCYEGGMLVNFKVRPWTKLLLPFFFVSQLITTAYLCIRYRPNVLHSHSLVPQGFVGLIVSTLLHIPHVTTSHGNDVFGLKPTGLMGWLKRIVLKQADAITVNSSATRKAVKEIVPDLPESQLHLIPAVPNEYPVDEALVASIHQRFPADKRILFVGRLIEEKGVLDLLDALELLLPEREGVHALIVGDGALREVIESRICRSPLRGRVHLLGWQPRETISSLMAAADCLVVPSKPVDGWQEAQGLVVAEAMAVGAPVVGSRLGGIPDMIKDGETGFLFESGDTVELRRTLDYLLFEQDNLDPVGVLGHYSLQFSSSAVSEKTRGLYLKVLGLDLNRTR